MADERFNFNPKIINNVKVVPRAKLVGRIRLADMLEQDEKSFIENTAKIESDPLFLKLFSPGYAGERAVRRARPFRLKLSNAFLEFKDELSGGGENVDVELLLQKKQKAGRLIKKIGEENFKSYFLFNDSGFDEQQVAAACGIDAEDVRTILEFVNELEAKSEFFTGSALAPENNAGYRKIAAIEKDGSGKFSVYYCSPRLARGKYLIDREVIAAQKKRGAFSKEELQKLEALIKLLETINTKKAVIQGALENIIELQREYLESGNRNSLVPLSQKAVAKRLEVSPSVVNRAVCARTVSLPSGKEAPLVDFFPSKKDVIKNILSKIFSDKTRKLKDDKISELIFDRYGFKVSRHLVQIYRKEMGIAPAGKR